MFNATNIKYELADKTQAMCYCGIGLIHKLVQNIGLIDAIDNHLCKPENIKEHFATLFDIKSEGYKITACNQTHTFNNINTIPTNNNHSNGSPVVVRIRVYFLG